MKILLYILLGLSLGAGLTLIALQERFLRERRRLMALGESQRAKSHQVMADANKKWEQQCQQLSEELQACQTRLTAAEAAPPMDTQGLVPQAEHERLIRENTAELSRLAEENRSLADHLAKYQGENQDLYGEIAELQGEIASLHGQLTTLQGEIATLSAEQKTSLDDDFILLGRPGGHLLPGSVVRALIKGRQAENR